MDTIIYHNDQRSANTFNSNLKSGDLNPLLRKSYKQLININTRFRNNYTITSATNFGFMMSTPVKKVVSMKVIDVQIPKIVYTVSSMLGSNNFIIDLSDGDKFTIDISDGSYTGTVIAATIQQALQTDASFVKVWYNSIDGKISFDGSGTNFGLNFGFNDSSCNLFSQTGSNLYKDQLTLGWMLGFRKNYTYRTPIKASDGSSCTNLNGGTSSLKLSQLRNLSKVHNRRSSLTEVKENGSQYLQQNLRCYHQTVYPKPLDICFNYTGKSSYTGEAVYDGHGSRYFLLSINDFQNNHNIAVVSPLQEETLGDGNILAKISSECCNKCCYENTERMYFGPTDIAKLHIILYDEFGRIVDLNNGDYSLTLELEVLYDL